MANQNEITIIKEKTFETIRSVVNKLVDTVRPTFGPAGNKVIIESPMYFTPLTVDDGVQIARDFKLDDSAENAVVKVIKETAIRTNDRVGDGTTGALIMLQAIINEVARKSKIEGHKIAKELTKGLAEAKDQLLKQVKQIKTKAELKKAALVSFDHEDIAEKLSDLFIKLGKDATITIEKSPTMVTYVEMSDGVTIDRGYISPYMINNPERMESVLEKPYILLTDYRITENTDILPLIQKMAEAKKNNLIIIADNVEQQALATLVINEPWVMNPQTNRPGVFASIAITIPTVEDKKVWLEDIALMTGAKVFSQEKGNKIEDAEIEDLGRCEKFICRRNESVIIKPGGDKKIIKNAVQALKNAVDMEKNTEKKKPIQKRIGMFTNTLAVIKVGAPTESEQKALKYKVEDAVNAVKSAYNDGVVCGGGLSLARIKTSSSILNEALKYPHRQLLENMGLDSLDIPQNKGYNVITGQVGDFMEVGVIDPVNVLIAAIESAVSIASLLLTSSGMIIEVPRVDTKGK